MPLFSGSTTIFHYSFSFPAHNYIEVVNGSEHLFLQVLERDLAIFGFFIALGRSTQSFLSANGYDVIDDPIEGFIRWSFWFLIHSLFN